MSISNYLENKIANGVAAAAGSTMFSASTARWVQLHTDDPGDDGTSSVASETARTELAFTASTNGVIVSASPAVWNPLSASEVLKYTSLWDSSAAGNCLGSGVLQSTFSTSISVNAGDSLTLAAGQISYTFT